VKGRGLVEAECPSCGTVVAPAPALVCGVSEAEKTALCEFHCPTCDRVLTRPVAPLDVNTLLLLGANRSQSLPFELLEAHSGPAVSWDEVLDLHLELEERAFPQDELVHGQAA
jgi:hypothetical protein